MLDILRNTNLFSIRYQEPKHEKIAVDVNIEMIRKRRKTIHYNEALFLFLLTMSNTKTLNFFKTFCEYCL